jgi:hypothetical protein
MNLRMICRHVCLLYEVCDLKLLIFIDEAFENKHTRNFLAFLDSNGRIFGACTSVPIRPSEQFFGRGCSTFLFTFAPHKAKLCSIDEQDVVGADAENDENTNATELRVCRYLIMRVDYILQIFTYTGANEYFVKASKAWLAIGLCFN